MTRRDEIESRRILAHYKRLILLGAVRLPLEQARRLVGTDCAYHLYGGLTPNGRRPRAKTR